jgi:hypothetical protein
MTPPPQPDSNTVTTRLLDFPGNLSPMLVKELRQGMRTNLFVIAFILLQCLMILSVMAGIASNGSSAVDGFFWFFIVLTLLVLQPLRGFNALSSEYTLNTMDLIQMTRLDGWRITLGKWTALNAQTLLLITGMLPYLVIRYFFGNVNFVIDLVGLGLLGLGSGLASAIMIGCSVFRYFVLRGILLVGFAISFSVLFSLMSSSIFRSGLTGKEFQTLGLVTVALLYGCFFFLSFGASRIAPLSENHAPRKRLVALGVSLLLIGLGFAGFDFDAIAVVNGLVLGFAVIDAVTEPIPLYSRVLVPFRKNAATRFSAHFLAPGWISGIGFFFLCSLLFGISQHLSGNLDLRNDPGEVILYLSMCNLLIFPLAIIHLFFGQDTAGQFTFALYAFIQAGLFLLTGLAMAMAGAIHQFETFIYMIFPIPSVLISANSQGDAEDPIFLAIAFCTTLISIAIPLVRHRMAYATFRNQLNLP